MSRVATAATVPGGNWRNSFYQRPGTRQTLPVEPARSYVICCVQRTGSWLLSHTLADTGYAGRPSDYFDKAERESRAREWGLPGDDLPRDGQRPLTTRQAPLSRGAETGRPHKATAAERKNGGLPVRSPGSPPRYGRLLLLSNASGEQANEGAALVAIIWRMDERRGRPGT